MPEETLTEEEIQKHKDDIDNLSREEMARLWRYAPSGHVYFIGGTEVHDHFAERFRDLGGMNPEISKKVGWGR